MINNFLRGLAYLKAGFSLISLPGLRRFAIVPIAVNICVFIGLTWLVSDQFSLLLANISWLHPDPESWLGWITSKLLFLFWALFFVALIIVFAYTFTLVANFIAAPFNSLLAERVEAHLRGHPDQQNSSIAHIVKSIPHIVSSEIGKLLYLLLWTIPVFALYWIPGINIAAPFVSFLFGAWMFSLEYIDYPMGNHGFMFGKIKKTARQHRNLSLGFGSAVTVLTTLPIINLIAMPVAVAGATKMWVDELAENTQKEQQ